MYYYWFSLLGKCKFVFVCDWNWHMLPKADFILHIWETILWWFCNSSSALLFSDIASEVIIWFPLAYYFIGVARSKQLSYTFILTCALTSETYLSPELNFWYAYKECYLNHEKYRRNKSLMLYEKHMVISAFRNKNLIL